MRCARPGPEHSRARNGRSAVTNRFSYCRLQSLAAATAQRIASVAYRRPRAFLDADDVLIEIAITGAIGGGIAVGTELFDLGEVTADGHRVASAGSIMAAQIVRAVLLIDPGVRSVRIPTGPRFDHLLREWQNAVKRWHSDFDAIAEKVLAGVSDARTKEAIRSSALNLLHSK